MEPAGKAPNHTWRQENGAAGVPDGSPGHSEERYTLLFRISKLEKALRENLGIPLFARLADEYLRRARVARALALCQEGCERFPDYPTGFLLLGRCYHARGNFEEARNALDRALRLDPENPAGFAALSAEHERLGETTLALQCMRQAAFLDPYSGDLQREAERLRRRSAAAPLVLPPAPEAVAGGEVPAEQREEGGKVEGGTAVPVPSPAAGGEAPPAGEAAASFPDEPGMDRETSNGEPPREESPFDGEPEASDGSAVSAAEREFLPVPESPGESVYPREPAGSRQEDLRYAGDPHDAAEAPPVPGGGGDGNPAPDNDLSAEKRSSGGVSSADSPPDVFPFQNAEPGFRDRGQTGVFFLVSEREDLEADAGEPPPEETLDPASEPKAELLTAPSARRAVARGTEVTSSGIAKPERPVARLSGRDDHELIGLLSEIETGEEVAPGTPVIEAGGEEPTAPVATVTLAELYIQQGIASKGIDIYRDLLRLHPDDDGIRGRLDSLEQALDS